MNNVISGLLSSRKAMVVIVIAIASFVALYLGKATFEQIESMVKWLVSSWLVSQGVEDAAAKYGAAKVEVAKVNSIPSPPPAVEVVI